MHEIFSRHYRPVYRQSRTGGKIFRYRHWFRYLYFLETFWPPPMRPLRPLAIQYASPRPGRNFPLRRFISEIDGLILRAVSSFGRAPHLQCGGDRSESGTVHHTSSSSS